jgi:alpha-mannosidase II
MTHPIREEWMAWKVSKGGAYLFVPGELVPYDVEKAIQENGYVLGTEHWKRTLVEKRVDLPGSSSGTATVIDLIYETNLQNANQEWLVRFTANNIYNRGIFHTDLNGFNFDTHKFRKDMPLQSQVFPMPTLASIEDEGKRLTVLSEHAQGTASTLEGTIDVWLDRRLRQDDARGLNQGVTDNVPTRTRLRIILEDRNGAETSDAASVSDNFTISALCKQMWQELNHPLELFGEVSPATSSKR